MEPIYSSVTFKKHERREAGVATSSKASADNEEVVYSTLAFSSPARPSPSSLPGPVEPVDPSAGARTKVMTKAWAKETLLLVCLCVLLVAVALSFGVLYTLGRISQEEFVHNFKEKLHQYNNSLRNCSLREHNIFELRVNMTQLEQEKRDLYNKNINLTRQLSEINMSIEQLQEETENLTSELQTLKAKARHCADGWKSFSGKCYYFSTDKKTWLASQFVCTDAGGHLVIITSPGEQNFLIESKPLNWENYWIGLTDAVEEKDWRWLDGTKLSETPRYWTGNEPDNWNGIVNYHPEGEDCAVMQMEYKTYSLGDAFCDKKNKYVCEAKAGM